MDTRRMPMDMGNAKASSSAGNTSQRASRPSILLAATGCLDAQHLASLCLKLTGLAYVTCVATKTSLNFIDQASIPSNLKLLTDEDEWSFRSSKGGVLHIEVIKRADIMIIAPLSANSLAKIGGGICNNMMTCMVRAWDFNKPLLVAPSMNKSMWSNPFTAQYLTVLRSMGVTVIDPIIVGEEAMMPDINVIFECARNLIHFNNAR